jgi:hypothetical protein
MSARDLLRHLENTFSLERLIREEAKPVKGILWGLLLSAPFWILLLFVIRVRH